MARRGRRRGAGVVVESSAASSPSARGPSVSLPSLARIPAPPDPILGLTETYRADPRPREDQPVGGRVHRRDRRDARARHGDRGRAPPAAGAGTKLYRPIDGEVAYQGARAGARARRGPRGRDLGRALATQTPGGTGGLRVARTSSARRAAARRSGSASRPGPTTRSMFQAAGFRVRPTRTPTRPGAGSTRPRCSARWERRARRRRAAPRRLPQPDRCRPVARPVAADRRPRGERGCCRWSTSPTRGSATASSRTRLGLLERPAGRRAARLDLVLEDVLAVRGARRRADHRRAVGADAAAGPVRT